ncbi:MAG: hypothetical protein D6798_15060, partial [Deltaproteobacteria bacterium]
MTAALLVLALVGCGDKTDGSELIGGDAGAGTDSGDTGDTGPSVDLDCPEIEHDEITESQPYGENVPIEATVTDPAGIFVVELYFKQETSSNWTRLTMSAAPGSDLYTAEIPGSQVRTGGMDYYLRAVDLLN